eukprot:NODE_600_length_2266_cov_51.630425_g570_i0.p1 GENE.NODE_600_length_2266_cov_51.630425_g570_i0~~NODE_600_length_2266_cov_51.630425_g570_i0.p1  ORF type:complete len:723 (-),score=110.97 NODE_600_length_2266_cov_51.630425_g570_i0:24-2192(-)
MDCILSDSDGLVEGIYHVLWRKPKTNVPYKFHFRLPDTILFKRNRPHRWFFTTVAPSDDPHNNRVRRKRQYHLSEKYMVQGMLNAARSISGLVAVWYNTAKAPVAGKLPLEIRYFTAKTLTEFLKYSNTKKDDGALQLFVDPKPGPDGKIRNEVLRTTWYRPGVCALDIRENIHHIDDSRLSDDDRCQTFEGYVHSRERTVYSDFLHNAVKAACEAIVAHIYCVANMSVQRMILYWKVDRHEELTLLYCTRCYAHEISNVIRPNPISNDTDRTQPHGSSLLPRNASQAVGTLWAGLRAVDADGEDGPIKKSRQQHQSNVLFFSPEPLVPIRTIAAKLAYKDLGITPADNKPSSPKSPPAVKPPSSPTRKKPVITSLEDIPTTPVMNRPVGPSTVAMLIASHIDTTMLRQSLSPKRIRFDDGWGPTVTPEHKQRSNRSSLCSSEATPKHNRGLPEHVHLHPGDTQQQVEEQDEEDMDYWMNSDDDPPDVDCDDEYDDYDEYDNDYAEYDAHGQDQHQDGVEEVPESPGDRPRAISLADLFSPEMQCPKPVVPDDVSSEESVVVEPPKEDLTMNDIMHELMEGLDLTVFSVHDPSITIFRDEDESQEEEKDEAQSIMTTETQDYLSGSHQYLPPVSYRQYSSDDLSKFDPRRNAEEKAAAKQYLLKIRELRALRNKDTSLVQFGAQKKVDVSSDISLLSCKATQASQSRKQRKYVNNAPKTMRY